MENYVNFSDRTTIRGYWMAFLINFIVSTVIGVIVAALPALSFLSTIYALAAFLPGLAISVRRLRDAGHTWKSLLLMLIPLVGWIFVIVRLCKKSV